MFVAKSTSIALVFFFFSSAFAEEPSPYRSQLQSIYIESSRRGIQDLKQAFNIKRDVPLKQKTIDNWRCNHLAKSNSELAQQYSQLEQNMLQDITEIRKIVRSRDFIPKDELLALVKQADQLNNDFNKYGCLRTDISSQIHVFHGNIHYTKRERLKAIERSQMTTWEYIYDSVF